MEEQWLYEGITGTYLPLLQTFEGPVANGVPYRCTVSLPASLIAMLTDDLLKERYARELDQLVELAGKELERTRPEPHYHRLARMYWDRFHSLRHTWRCHDGNLVRAFRRLQEAGRVEVITSTPTHAFFPLLDRNWAALRAQVHVAADQYERHFGYRPRGMWLAECGYVPGVDDLLFEAAMRHFLVDTHGILLAERAPVYGTYGPLYCHTGGAAFGRDPESSAQVWSAREGYPGDLHYRDFYRDIGFDLPLEYIALYIHPERHRTYTGIKYHAITHDQLHDKWVYDPDVAHERAGQHAAHFRMARQRQVDAVAGVWSARPSSSARTTRSCSATGGTTFLGDLFRQLHHDQPPSRRSRRGTISIVTRPTSSRHRRPRRGDTGDTTTAAERMVELAHRYPTAEEPVRRALEAVRELLLMQASDWPFIMRTGTSVSYATPRMNEHILRFTRIYEELKQGRVTESWLEDVEARDSNFPDLDYRLYAS